MLNITLKQLRYFEALARLGHFGQAAEVCAVTQPALSMQIQELEKTLGVKLLERNRNGVMLTDAGRAFVHGALPERHQHLRALWADFSDVEKTALEALLRKMLTRLGG